VERRCARVMVNHQIGMATGRPRSAYLEALIRGLGFNASSAVAMMTGVDIRKTSYAMRVRTPASQRGDGGSIESSLVVPKFTPAR
jgi:hypothetical protein